MPYWDFGDDYSNSNYGDSGGMGFNFDAQPTGFMPLTRQATPSRGQNFGIPEYDYTPLNKYNSYMESMPQRADHKLGFWQNLAALGSGALQGYASRNPAQGIDVYQELRDAPFKQAYGDWARKEPMLKAGVDKANASYDREIKRSQAQRQFEKDQADYSLKSVDAISQIQRRLDQTQTERDRINILKEQVAKQGVRDVTDDRGMVHLVYPDGSTVPTGVRANALTLDDRKDLQRQQGSITRGNQSALEDQRFEHTKSIEELRAGNRKDLKETTPGGSTQPKVISPASQEKARQNAMQRLWEANPERVMQFFATDSKGNSRPDPEKIKANPKEWERLIAERDALADDELTPKNQGGYRQVGPPQAGDIGRFKVTKRPR